MSTDSATSVIEARDLCVTYPIRHKAWRRPLKLAAVRGVNLSIKPGETLGLVGESGSGKSTTGRALLRLAPVSHGHVYLDREDITRLSQRDLRPLRRRMQMVFQDPYSSLDPSATIGDIVGEPLQVHTDMNGRARDERVRELLAAVGLPTTAINHYPREFSGGQRQRVAIARAITVRPDLLVLDEAVSALDVSTQNQILELLVGMREEQGLAYLFISHNLAVVRALAHQTAVMYLGQIVESGPTARIYRSPAHPYTQALIDAVPLPSPRLQRTRPKTTLVGDTPDPLNPPSGCAFRTRCPDSTDICSVETPTSRRVAGGGWVACHHARGHSAPLDVATVRSDFAGVAPEL